MLQDFKSLHLMVCGDVVVGWPTVIITGFVGLVKHRLPREFCSLSRKEKASRQSAIMERDKDGHRTLPRTHAAR